MKGAIAAGHPLTAEAGARVLREGGSAVDACIAAAFVSWVCESPLTGPGGGGFMLAHDAASGRTTVLDCFVSVPAGASAEPELLELAVDFDGDTQQLFRTGAAAVAVPGTARGLAEAHARWGRTPWPELCEPAIHVAVDGFELTPMQGYLHQILDGLLRHSPEGDALYGRDGGPYRTGDRFAAPELGETLERIAADGADVLYRGELAERIVDHVRAGGGALTLDDLDAYAVVERDPVSVEYRGHEFRSNPPPSSGGVLIALGLRSLGEREPTPSAVAAAMDAQEAARGAAFAGALRSGDALQLLKGTTHISVVDSEGNAASLSASLGSGSGVVVPGTGIHLNNMLGELDLAGASHPGERLTSMMAPSLVLRDGAPRLVLGSAGSARLRGAILQVVANVIGRGLDVEAAVEAPRVHAEAGVVHCEDASVADALEAEGRAVVRWKDRNLFFGGVSAVEVRDGETAAAGDPRRGGVGLVA